MSTKMSKISEVTEGQKRSDLTVHCPVVFGSMAFWLGKKADESATHRWTLYVRGANGENLSYFVSKVVFFLHESFAQSVRTITEPPYEVTEAGWGEFDTRIRLYFKDPLQDPVEIVYPLKLYPANNVQPVVKKPVVYEIYDEVLTRLFCIPSNIVVFTNPSPELYDSIMGDSKKEVIPNAMQEHLNVFSDVTDMRAIQRAQLIVTAELNRVKDDIAKHESEKESLKMKV